MDRYDNLITELEYLATQQKSLNMLEIGTYDGTRASNLLRHWLKIGKGYSASYVGFDLFEDLTPEMSKAEMSKSKLPPRCVDVAGKLSVIKGVAVQLVRGNTRTTLPAYVDARDAAEPPFDLIFMDGGHSLDTIESDFAAVERIMTCKTVILLDDYYVNRDDFGCQRLVKRLQEERMPNNWPKWQIEMLDPMDTYEHTKLQIRMVRVRYA